MVLEPTEGSVLGRPYHEYQRCASRLNRGAELLANRLASCVLDGNGRRDSPIANLASRSLGFDLGRHAKLWLDELGTATVVGALIVHFIAAKVSTTGRLITRMMPMPG